MTTTPKPPRTRQRKHWVLAVAGATTRFSSWPKLLDYIQANKTNGKVYRGEQFYCCVQDGVAS